MILLCSQVLQRLVSQSAGDGDGANWLETVQADDPWLDHIHARYAGREEDHQRSRMFGYLYDYLTIIELAMRLAGWLAVRV